MITLTMDMVQYDCPFIDTTADYDVSISGAHWDYDTARELFETHLVVVGADRAELDNGLDALRDHPNTDGYRLLSKRDDTAVVRTTAAQTSALEAIKANGGFLTGTFESHNGHEIWRVGFDNEADADAGLSDVDRENDYTVLSRERIATDDLTDLLQHAGAATTLLGATRDLSDTERATLRTAVETGYFESPREADLGALAAEFGVSKAAVSQNIRRAERKALGAMVRAMDRLD